MDNEDASSMSQSSSAWTEPPWSGWIETTGDALLILEAARRGLIPRVTRRLVDAERKMITSGSVFVFDEDESGIKRWTDGFFWSPSRILGNFLLYRETDKRGPSHRGRGDEQQQEAEDFSTENPANRRPRTDGRLLSVAKHRERSLVGSLTNSYKFKPDGLMKKVRLSCHFLFCSLSIYLTFCPDFFFEYRRSGAAPDILLQGRRRGEWTVTFTFITARACIARYQPGISRQDALS